MAEGDNDTCLELALEGEKLCKAGKCRDGVAFFEAALQVGKRPQNTCFKPVPNFITSNIK